MRKRHRETAAAPPSTSTPALAHAPPKMQKMQNTQKTEADAHHDRLHPACHTTALFAWAVAHGADLARIRPHLDPVSRLRGIVAASRIPAGSLIARIPPNLVLCETAAAASPLGRRLHTHMLREESLPRELARLTASDAYALASLRLAAVLAFERYHRRSTVSVWDPYLRALPLDYPLHPLAWPDSLCDAYLTGTSLFFIVENRRNMIRAATRFIAELMAEAHTAAHVEDPESSKLAENELHDFLFDPTSFYDCWDGNFITEKELEWGYLTVVSRAFPKGCSMIVDGDSFETKIDNASLSADAKQEAGSASNDASDNVDGGALGEVTSKASSGLPFSELCLYPVLDMINHKRNQKIEWNTRVSPGVSFLAPEEIPEGEIVWNNYGSKGNENLLANYGFTITPNPEDYAKISLATPAETDPLHSFRTEILAAHNIPTVHLLFLPSESADADTLPRALVLAAKILVGTRREISALVDAGEDAVGASGSARLDIIALATVWRLLRARIEGLGTGAARAAAYPLPLCTCRDSRCCCDAALNSERLQLASVYRDGQLKIFHHTRGLTERAIKHILSDKATREITLSQCLLTVRNGSQSGEVLTAIAELLNCDTVSDPTENDDTFDQETILSLILMHEESLGDKSAFSAFFERTKRSFSEAEAIMGNQTKDISDYYNESVAPILQKSRILASMAETNIFTPERFVWASSFLDTHGVTLQADLLQALDVMELLDDESDEAVFGILLM
ncbi:hypothetical protein HDU84_000915 [Entophlyctis sp. JEL0112]|nr:hypothetical protein HDU84_000915 [Entophlyctis sp. JEL0112]